ncbi:TolC family outer membrane protein [Azospirillum halopraeferens]|uniref:TolC family outer membrane protein n=1 Tax=Azospirillum halopraeferens TaxID=34010 RepID=UPI000402D06A|nr:TolC family outer membrane protein [Azospirillum halopraeferens]
MSDRRSRTVHRWLATALLAGAAFGFSAAAGAQSLEQALAQAYATNPALAAQRAQLRAVDETVAQALSGYRPSVQATADVTRNATNSRVSGAGTVGNESTPKSVGVSVTQPLYNATVAPSVRRSEALVQAQRATVLSTEQTVLLQAATAYLDVVQDQAVLTLATNQEQVLRRNLEAARDRFRVGEYTRTDVSQSESRLAEATANRIASEGALQVSRARYERAVGSRPGELKAPKPTFKLPRALDDAVEMARANNPAVLAASFNEEAQRQTVDQLYGNLLPSANLSAAGQSTFDPSSSSGVNIDRTDSLQFRAQVVIPLYQAGLPEARVREAKQTANRFRIQIEDTRRQVVESAISGWQSLATARASIASYRSQISAAEIALEGVRQEAQVGSRTVLDVLNQEQELLNARVNLVRAQRQEMVAAFQLLSAIGSLTAQQLNLPVDQYNMDDHYQQVRGKWWGTDVTE